MSPPSSDPPRHPPRGSSLRQQTNDTTTPEYGRTFADMFDEFDQADADARDRPRPPTPPSPNTRMRMAASRGLPSLPTQQRFSIADSTGRAGGAYHFERRTTTRDEEGGGTPERGGILRFGPRLDHESNPSPVLPGPVFGQRNQQQQQQHQQNNQSSIRSSLDSSFNPPPLQSLPSDHSLDHHTPITGLSPTTYISFGNGQYSTPQTGADAVRSGAQEELYTPPDQIHRSRYDRNRGTFESTGSSGARTASDLLPDGQDTPTWSYHSSDPSNAGRTPEEPGSAIADLIGDISISPQDQPSPVTLSTPARDQPNPVTITTPEPDIGTATTPARDQPSHDVVMVTPAGAQPTTTLSASSPAQSDSQAYADDESDGADQDNGTDIESPPRGHFKYVSDVDRLRSIRNDASMPDAAAAVVSEAVVADDVGLSPDVPIDPRSPPPANPALPSQAAESRMASTKAAAQSIHWRMVQGLDAGGGSRAGPADGPSPHGGFGILAALAGAGTSNNAPSSLGSSAETRPLLHQSAEDLSSAQSRQSSISASTALERDGSSSTLTTATTQVDPSGISRQTSLEPRSVATSVTAGAASTASKDKGKHKVRFPEPVAQAAAPPPPGEPRSGLRKLMSFSHNRARPPSNDKPMPQSKSGDSLDRIADNQGSYMNLESEPSAQSLPRKPSTKSFTRLFGKGGEGSSQPAKIEEEATTRYRVPRTPYKGKPVKRVPDPFRKLGPGDNPLDSPITTVVDEEEYRRQQNEQKRPDSLYGSLKGHLKNAGASVKSLGTRRSNSGKDKDEHVFQSQAEEQETSPTAAAAGSSRRPTKAERVLGAELTRIVEPQHASVPGPITEEPEEIAGEQAQALPVPTTIEAPAPGAAKAEAEAEAKRARMVSTQSAVTTTASLTGSSSRHDVSETEIMTAFIQNVSHRGRSPATTHSSSLAGDTTPRGSDRERTLTQAQAIQQGYETIRRNRERRASLAPHGQRASASPTRPPLQAITAADTTRIMAQAEERAPLSVKLVRQAQSVPSLKSFRKQSQKPELAKTPNLKSPSFASLRSMGKVARRVQSESNVRKPKSTAQEWGLVPADRLRSPGLMGLSEELGLLGLDDPATHARYHRLPSPTASTFASLRPFTESMETESTTSTTVGAGTRVVDLREGRPQLVSRSSSSLLGSPPTVREPANPAEPKVSSEQTPVAASAQSSAPSPLSSQAERRGSSSSARRRPQSGPTNIHAAPKAYGWPSTPGAGQSHDDQQVTPGAHPRKPGPNSPGEFHQPRPLMTPTIITTDEHNTPVLAHEGRLIAQPMGNPLRYPSTPGSAASNRSVSMTQTTKWWDGKVEENPDLDLSARGPSVASAVVQAIRRARSATQLAQPYGLGLGLFDSYDSLLPPCPAPMSEIAPHVIYWSPILRREDKDGVGKYHSPAAKTDATHAWVPCALALSVVEDPSVSPNTGDNDGEDDSPRRVEAYLHLFHLFSESVTEATTTTRADTSPKVKLWPSFSSWFSKTKKAEKDPTSMRPTPPPLAELAKFAGAEKERLQINMYTFCRTFDPLINTVGSRENKSPSRPGEKGQKVRWHETDYTKCLLEVTFDAEPECWILQLPYEIRSLQSDWVAQIEDQRTGAQARDLLLSSQQVKQIRLGMKAPRRPSARSEIHDDIFGSRPAVQPTRRDSGIDADDSASPTPLIRRDLGRSADRPGPDQGILKRNKSTTDLTHPTVPLVPAPVLQAPKPQSLLQGSTWWHMEQHIRSQNSDAFDWIRHSRYDTSASAQAQIPASPNTADWGVVFGYPVSLDRVKLYWRSTTDQAPPNPSVEASTSIAAMPEMVHTFSRETTTTDLATNPSQQSNLSDLAMALSPDTSPDPNDKHLPMTKSHMPAPPGKGVTGMAPAGHAHASLLEAPPLPVVPDSHPTHQTTSSVAPSTDPPIQPQPTYRGLQKKVTVPAKNTPVEPEVSSMESRRDKKRTHAEISPTSDMVEYKQRVQRARGPLPRLDTDVSAQGQQQTANSPVSPSPDSPGIGRSAWHPSAGMPESRQRQPLHGRSMSSNPDSLIFDCTALNKRDSSKTNKSQSRGRRGTREVEAAADPATRQSQTDQSSSRNSTISAWSQAVADSTAFDAPQESIDVPRPTEGYGGQILLVERSRAQVTELYGRWRAAARLQEQEDQESRAEELDTYTTGPPTGRHQATDSRRLSYSVPSLYPPSKRHLATHPVSLNDPTFEQFCRIPMLAPPPRNWPDYQRLEIPPVGDHVFIPDLQAVWDKRDTCLVG